MCFFSFGDALTFFFFPPVKDFFSHPCAPFPREKISSFHPLVCFFYELDHFSSFLVRCRLFFGQVSDRLAFQLLLSFRISLSAGLFRGIPTLYTASF